MNTAMRYRSLCAALPLAAFLAGRTAEAQTSARLSLRLEAGAGLMLPEVQRDQLGYDSAHVQVALRAGFRNGIDDPWTLHRREFVELGFKDFGAALGQGNSGHKNWR